MKKIIICSLVVLLAGCTTGEKIGGLHPGMSADQVSDILGRPDGMSVNGDCTTSQYTNRLVSGWGWDRGDYYVTTCKGKVVSYGSGDVRTHENPLRPSVGVVVMP